MRAVEIRLINPKAPERCQGVVCSLKEGYGFIERADVVREIFFHYSEYKDDISTAILGEDVDFAVQTRNVSSKKLQVFLSLSNCSYLPGKGCRCGNMQATRGNCSV